MPTGTADVLNISERSRSARWLVSGLLFCGMILMGVGLFFFQSIERTASHLFYWILFIGGLALFAVGSLAIRLPKWMDWLERQARRIKSQLGIQSRQSLYLIVSIVAVIITTQAAGFGPLMRAPSLAVTSWFVGIFLAILVVGTPMKKQVSIRLIGSRSFFFLFL